MASITPELKAYVPPSFYDDKGDLLVSVDEAERVAKQVADHVKTLPPAEQALYVSLLGSPDFAPAGGAPSPDKVDEILTRLDVALSKLLDAGVDKFLELAVDIYELGELLILQAHDLRESDLQARLDARMAAKAELYNQSAKMQEAANALLTGGAVSLGMAVLGGALGGAAGGLQLFSSFKMLRGLRGVRSVENTGDSLKTKIDLENYKTDIKKLEADSGRYGGLSQIFQSVGMLLQGASGAANTIGQAESQRIQALGSLFAALAQEIGAQGDMRKESQTSLEELIRSLMNAVKEIADSEAESRRTLTQV